MPYTHFKNLYLDLEHKWHPYEAALARIRNKKKLLLLCNGLNYAIKLLLNLIVWGGEKIVHTTKDLVKSVRVCTMVTLLTIKQIIMFDTALVMTNT